MVLAVVRPAALEHQTQRFKCPKKDDKHCSKGKMSHCMTLGRDEQHLSQMSLKCQMRI